MKTRTETKVIEQTITTYIAVDGKEFETETQCKEYEESLEAKQYIPLLEQLEMKELKGYMPPSLNGDVFSENYFEWYKINSAEDIEIIRKAYSYDFYEYEPDVYPSVICVERTCWKYDDGEAYIWFLDGLILNLENFFRNMNLEMKLTPIAEESK